MENRPNNVIDQNNESESDLNDQSSNACKQIS